MTDAADNTFLIISPCRNEQEYMRETLDSMVAQTVRPTKWLIVDDGSTDDTPLILAEYAKQHEWIEVITRVDRGFRNVGPGVIEAFNFGFDYADTDAYAFVCKLDLDLRLPPRYFEILLAKMAADPLIATCSGKSYIEENGRLVFENHGDDTSLGMTKFYRMSCLKEMGGFVQQVMWDGIDCHRCRMNGWKAVSWDEADLRFVHLRPMGSSQVGIITGRIRNGFGQYFMGTSLLYITAAAFSRLLEKPYVIGSLAIIWGWLKSFLKREPRYDDLEFRRFLRAYQWRVLLKGKRKALAITHSEVRLSQEA